MSLDTPVAQDFRDAAYNNGAAVPSWTETFARWTEQSAVIRARHAATMDLPYGPGERTKIDLFPGTNPEAPCLVYFHGGYWMRNSREMFANLGEGVRAHGWSVAIPGYTLAPEASLREIVAECEAALDWLQAHGPAHGVRGPLVVAGWSAGGHLAAVTLAHPAVKAGLAISGIFELAPLRDTYLDEKLKLELSEIADLSPQRRPVVMKPLTITYGAEELPALVANSVGFHALRTRAGAPGDLKPIGGAHHFSVLDGLLKADGDLTGMLLALG
ncbi:alpha/beta hydrolase [Phreatobacter aquaticus]|uniref:Alpha/beta hydrolase n=1 Tax=Phreatobacter aquaticus TaxID=2570229 RepID=A0A4D7QKX0_9HYPH|nr:alpha/beta hydrolase [Phreatobacter aquaticus]QCK87705.1 alpha/beta hydrolase [Phreatobacter aquaticus]